ncbi:swi5-dependent recombination DNA repair protein 1 homolog isoform X1 [Pygocentrus nattereri]|uniref:Swi5-dependent recombination DNA repair protein 1 homolog n=2 Tax=Pygocentrus nattereri TaxID=42514 RepID=A0A3B4CC80_PYGNA|nr:swi5-dependent recombination DNA repair protein 1 homolog isoform X1 [Pygocentrus nattereri]
MDKTPERLSVEQQASVPSGSSVGKPMSAALKARLKRARPSFTSPLSVVKRLKIDDDELPQPLKEETDQTGQAEKEAEIDVNRNETMRDLKDPLQLSRSELLQLREKLKKDAREKSETLRRLKMVKMFRMKNDLTQLQDLIDKWRHCAQAVLYELQTELPTDGRKVSLSQLIDHFGLEDGILHFDRTEDDFINS